MPGKKRGAGCLRELLCRHNPPHPGLCMGGNSTAYLDVKQLGVGSSQCARPAREEYVVSATKKYRRL